MPLLHSIQGSVIASLSAHSASDELHPSKIALQLHKAVGQAAFG